MAMKRTILIIGAAGALIVGLSGFTYDYNDGTYGPPGSTKVLGSEEVSQWDQGRTCDVTIDLANNESVRPGSDITVSSGSSSQTFPNTEAVKGDPGPVTVSMVLGQEITATLTFGPNHEYDGKNYDNAAFSGSGTVEVGDCVPVPPISPSTPPRVEIATPAAVQAPAPVQAVPRTTG